MTECIFSLSRRNRLYLSRDSWRYSINSVCFYSLTDNQNIREHKGVGTAIPSLLCKIYATSEFYIRILDAVKSSSIDLAFLRTETSSNTQNSYRQNGSVVNVEMPDIPERQIRKLSRTPNERTIKSFFDFPLNSSEYFLCKVGCSKVRGRKEDFPGQGSSSEPQNTENHFSDVFLNSLKRVQQQDCSRSIGAQLIYYL